MECEYFGKCGSCTLQNLNYKKQLDFKIQHIKELFGDIEFKIFPTLDGYFRDRIEFQIIHKDDAIFYAKRSANNSKSLIAIKQCAIANVYINSLMPKLKQEIEKVFVLKERLFEIDFLSNTKGEIVVTLIYHKKLDDLWSEAAKRLREKLKVHIIGRSRKQKIVHEKEFVIQEINHIKLMQVENTFTQPNNNINQKIISFLQNSAKGLSKDLLELYCGSGNLTLMLSSYFDKIIGIEVSKSSIRAANKNLELNQISNVKFFRMSAQEFSDALSKKREFYRLRDIDLEEYDFQTVLVDPPRAGLDEKTINIVKNFQNIFYISCNPLTLKENLNTLLQTHKIKDFALFDQFAYTKHIECGVVLEKN